MISPQHAQNRMLDKTRTLPPEKIALRGSLGHVLAEPVVPQDDSPPFDNSAKDGFAVRADDVAGATKENPKRLRVVETIPAGTYPTMSVEVGTTSKIMTGAPLPEGADAVVMVEDTKMTEGQVLIFREVESGQEVRRAGEDLKRGVGVLEPGTVLNAARIGLAAASGYSELLVYPRPKVGILVTGGELVEPGEPLPPGKIRNSNAYALFGQVTEAGGVPLEFGVAHDDRKALEEMISNALEKCDILITSGGVSMGDYDYVTEAAQAAGVELHFTKIAQRPGKPMVGGSAGSKLFFGLPGNPVSVMVCFEVYVRPAIRKMLGRENLFRPTIFGHFRKPFSKVGNLHFWTRVIVEKDEGKILLRPSANQRSDILRSMALGNGLAEIPVGVETVPVGQPVLVHLLEGAERLL